MVIPGGELFFDVVQGCAAYTGSFISLGGFIICIEEGCVRCKISILKGLFLITTKK